MANTMGYNTKISSPWSKRWLSGAAHKPRNSGSWISAWKRGSQMGDWCHWVMPGINLMPSWTDLSQDFMGQLPVHGQVALSWNCRPLWQGRTSSCSVVHWRELPAKSRKLWSICSSWIDHRLYFDGLHGEFKVTGWMLANVWLTYWDGMHFFWQMHVKKLWIEILMLGAEDEQVGESIQYISTWVIIMYLFINTC